MNNSGIKEASDAQDLVRQVADFVGENMTARQLKAPLRSDEGRALLANNLIGRYGTLPRFQGFLDAAGAVGENGLRLVVLALEVMSGLPWDEAFGRSAEPRVLATKSEAESEERAA